MTRGSPLHPRGADDAAVTIAVGQRLRTARKRAGLNQQQVADLVGLSRSAVGQRAGKVTGRRHRELQGVLQW